MTDMPQGHPEDSLPFASFLVLRGAHTELLKHKTGEPPGEDAIKAFLRRGVAAGAILDESADRWEAQTLLDYWVATLGRMGIPAQDATLSSFDPEQAPKLDDESCPYRGLDAFRQEQHELFFGRQRVIDSLLVTLGRHRVLPVLGPSGSGKSSVVMAGLIPALRRGAIEGSEAWHYLPPVVPGAEPLEALARMVRGGEAPGIAWLATAAVELRKNKHHLARLLAELSPHAAVVVIDQLEEIFTLCQDDHVRDAFIGNLLHLAEIEEPRHRVILTIRTDFEASVAKVEKLQEHFERASVRVTPMNARELRDAILRPAELVGLKFEEGLVDQLIHDFVGEPAALPLLQFTLLKLWEKRARNKVTRAAYAELGSGRTALALTAERFYKHRTPEDQDTIKHILLRLVRPGEGTEVMSSRVRRSTLFEGGPPAERVERNLERLIDEDLVRVTPGDKPDGGDDRVEVAHEALVRNWPTLVDLLNLERSHLRNRLQLTSAAERWATSGRPSALLLRGQILEEAGGFGHLGETESAFVRVSEQRERRDRRLRLFAKVGVVTLSVALAVSAISQLFTARRYAQSLSSLVKIQSDVVRGALSLEEDPELALALLSRAADPRAATPLEEESADLLNEATSTLMNNALMAYSIRPRERLDGLGRIYGVDHSASVSVPPDGAVVAIGPKFGRRTAAYNHLFLFDPNSSKPPLGIAARALGLNPANNVSVFARFSARGKPGGASLAIGTFDSQVRFFNVNKEACSTGNADRCVQRVLTAFEGTLRRPVSMAWDSSGRWLAVGDIEGNVRVFDTDRGTPHDWQLPTRARAHVAFVADGRSLLIAAKGGLYRWQDVSARADPLLLDVVLEEEVLSLSAASRTQLFALATANGELKLIDLAAPGRPEVKSLAPAVPGAGQIGWSPDGQYLAVGGRDRVIRVWNKTGKLVATSPAFNGVINDVAWRVTSDATRLAHLVVAGDFDPYDRDGWNKRTGGHIEIVDVTYLFEDSRLKKLRVDRILNRLNLADLESRCGRLLRDEAGECAALSKWIVDKRLTNSIEAR